MIVLIIKTEIGTKQARNPKSIVALGRILTLIKVFSLSELISPINSTEYRGGENNCLYAFFQLKPLFINSANIFFLNSFSESSFQ